MVVMERFRADPVGTPVVRLGRSAQGFWLGAHAELEVGVCKIRKRIGSGGPRSRKSDPLGRTCFVVPEREGDEGDFWQSRMAGVQWQQVACVQSGETRARCALCRGRRPAEADSLRSLRSQ